MRNTYIKNRTNIIENLKKKVVEGMNLKDTIFLLSAGTLGVFTFYSIFGLPSITIGAGILTGLSVYNKYKNKRINELTIARYDQEKNHLADLVNNDPADNPRLNHARVRKMTALTNTIQNAKDAYENANFTANALGVATIIGAGLTCAFSGLWFIPAIAAVSSIIASENAISKNKELQNADLRYNNINNDLYIARIVRAANNNNNQQQNQNNQGQNQNQNQRQNQNNQGQNNNQQQNQNNQQQGQNNNQQQNQNNQGQNNNQGGPRPLPNRNQQQNQNNQGQNNNQQQNQNQGQQQPQQPQNQQCNNTQQTYSNIIDRYINRLVRFGDNYLNNKRTK